MESLLVSLASSLGVEDKDKESDECILDLETMSLSSIKLP